MRPFMREVGLLVRSHHERWDGCGYPDGLAGEEIPLEARIITCCDSWNAMRTDRVYRKALTLEAALDELTSGAGTQFDPQLVEALLPIIERTEGGRRLLRRRRARSRTPCRRRCRSRRLPDARRRPLSFVTTAARWRLAALTTT